MSALGIYVHVPFCAVRCGYCDFNTYAPGELDGASPAGYVGAALAEVRLARKAMRGDDRPVSTVFFGGGTPTLLDAGVLATLLESVREAWHLAADAEVTTEANPDSVTAESIAALANAGFTRVSLGMQSAVPHVLKTLERTHQPENIARAVEWAREAGLQVSLDLIYGTPGESLADWEISLDAAIALEPDHVSAYALVIEPGTKMGAQVRRRQIPPVDLDAQAAMYEVADERLSAAGFSWYEVSNWSTSRETRCRHNVGYWNGDDWWGIGPGAHSYVAGHPDGPRRWWNVKHPRVYAERLAVGESPEQDHELLRGDQIAIERVMLGIRLADGMRSALLSEHARAAVPGLVERGLLDSPAWDDGRAALTLRGRLLADAVVRDLT